MHYEDNLYIKIYPQNAYKITKYLKIAKNCQNIYNNEFKNVLIKLWSFFFFFLSFLVFSQFCLHFVHVKNLQTNCEHHFLCILCHYKCLKFLTTLNNSKL